MGDQKFENTLVNDDYVKELKGRDKESVYIEKQEERLLFTNSCWEI